MGDIRFRVGLEDKLEPGVRQGRRALSSPDEAIQLYNSLKSGSQVSIEITRRGKKRMLTYDIQ